MRQALDLSIDREALNQVAFNGEFMPGNQWVSPSHPYYQQSSPIRLRDVEKAKALLKEAGVSPPVSIDYMVRQTNTRSNIVFPYYQVEATLPPPPG